MKTTNNNIIKFPRMLGSRLRINVSKNNTNKQEIDEINSFNNMVFYGNESVLKFYGTEPNLYDMWLYFQLIEAFQKGNISFENKEFIDCDIETSQEAKQKLMDNYFDLYKNELTLFSTNKEKQEFLMSKVEIEIERRKSEIEKVLYLKSEQVVVVNVDFASLLKERGLTTNLNNKMALANSLKRLTTVGLEWYILDSETSEEFKKIKQKHKNNSSLYLDELKECFQKNYTKSKNYFRTLLHDGCIKDNYSTGVIRIDKGFFDLTLKSETFDFSVFKKIKGNVSKILYVNLAYAYKSIMSKEYLYEILNLEQNRRDDKKLETVQEAIKELIKNNILDKSSGYDKTNKVFKIVLDEDFAEKSGYKQKHLYLQKQEEYQAKKRKQAEKKLGNKK